MFASALIPLLIAAPVDFDADVRPIFAERCVECHSGVRAAGGISFVFRSTAVKRGESGARVIVPGDASASELIARVLDPDDPMPPAGHGAMLDESEVAALRQWIDEGARWPDHWAYVAPAAGDERSLDAFIEATHVARGLTATDEAAPHELLRRLSFDLTGLPPSIEEQHDFMAAWERDPDAATDAAVDRLLASAHFGERWAAWWMDLARYADTMGYEKDPHRDMWPYRDWLIAAFNEDAGYDAFVRDQLAGDLAPDPTFGQRVATAFHRNTQTNTEGGTFDEEFRVAAVIDRVNTTWQVFLGTTFSCVQCHAHAYDPFTHESYYESFAIFNNAEDNDDFDYPTLAVPTDRARWDEAEALDRTIERLHRARVTMGRDLAVDTSWLVPPVERVHTTGEGDLVLEEDGSTVRVDGTIPWNAVYEVDVEPVPGTLGAIRIDALLDRAEAGRANGGFVVSEVRAARVRGEEVMPIPLGRAWADATRGDSRLGGVLSDDAAGWTIFPNQFHPHWLVVVPAEPVEVAADDRLRISIHHRKYSENNRATLGRFRLAVTSDLRWSELDESAIRDPLVEATAARTQIASVRLPVTTTRGRERQRDSFVFERGNWLAPAARVNGGVPDVLGGSAAAVTDRAALAAWMTARDHPLTARVLVNRIWAELFGRGIVATVDDLGTQGERPTHPELLDALARRFVDEQDWSLKALLRSIVTSQAYRRSARATKNLREADPDNRWLTRGPRRRLSAEMVRDQALATSGLITRTIGGPSVMPPQPEGIWQVVYSGARWKEAEGPDRYRRGLYTYWRRTSPYPSFVTFDAPSREFCSGSRLPTNTPLQALVTLNDPVYVECAAALAERMCEGSERTEDRLRRGVRLVLGREPDAMLLAELAALHDDLVAAGTADPLSVVAGTLLNLDEALVR